MSRKLIVCCDGTGNEIKKNQSNVLKFHRLLEKNSSQITYYDPGVGTISDSSDWQRWKSQSKMVFGLATGFGLDGNVLDAYRFLLNNYREGDQVYLLGFSRGAYTVRVLAGFINMVGLLAPENENLCGYALTGYKQASQKDDLAIAWRFQEVMETRRITIRFMGCWDTVGSVIVPRPDRLYVPSLEELPYTRQNPCVQAFRHALAIDERRRMFRVYPWENGQKFKTNPFVKDEAAKEQDCKQVWFAGVHADIGGGYPESESGAAKFPLRWMVEEAKAAGLTFRKTMFGRLVEGNNPKGSTRHYAAPDVNAALHNSMNKGWKILEYLPKSAKRVECKNRSAKLGMYLPKCEPRTILQDAVIDDSVWQRTQYCPGKPYKPENLKGHSKK